MNRLRIFTFFTFSKYKHLSVKIEQNQLFNSNLWKFYLIWKYLKYLFFKGWHFYLFSYLLTIVFTYFLFLLFFLNF